MRGQDEEGSADDSLIGTMIYFFLNRSILSSFSFLPSTFLVVHDRTPSQGSFFDLRTLQARRSEGQRETRRDRGRAAKAHLGSVSLK